MFWVNVESENGYFMVIINISINMTIIMYQSIKLIKSENIIKHVVVDTITSPSLHASCHYIGHTSTSQYI